jgi:lipopolysaccharide biosynthesis regulator YciM
MKSLKLKSLLLKEEDEGIGKKVKTAVNKIKKAVEEKEDTTQALIELAKLVGEKKCVTKLEAIKEIEKVEEGTPYFIDQYKKEVEKCLMDIVKEKFEAKEYGAVISSM